jgi:hypothetical protein
MGDISRLKDMILRAKTEDERLRLKRELTRVKPTGYFTVGSAVTPNVLNTSTMSLPASTSRTTDTLYNQSMESINRRKVRSDKGVKRGKRERVTRAVKEYEDAILTNNY